MEEIISATPATGSMADFNGWTELDLSTRLNPGKCITHLGMKSNASGSFRPSIWRRVNPHFDNVYRCVYRHPSMVSHPGDGAVKWAECENPVALRDGHHYAGAYLSGFGASSTPMAGGRIDQSGDLSGTVTFGTRGNYPVPAMGARYQAAPFYAWDFEHGTDGWSANVANLNTDLGIQNGTEFFSQNWTNDLNHHSQNAGDPAGIGKTLSLFAWRYHEEQNIDGSYALADLRGKTITPRFRIDNWSAPQDTEIMLWVQSRGATLFSNWGLRSVPLIGYADGQWHAPQIVIPNDEAAWVFGGGLAPSYGHLALDTTLANVQDIFFVAARPIASASPAGKFRLDSIVIEAAA